jgi:hypothetical protein
LSIHLHHCQGESPPSTLSSRPEPPGFPAARHSQTPACVAFSEESRMKLANAANLDDRKPGVAKWRTCCFSSVRSDGPNKSHHPPPVIPTRIPATQHWTGPRVRLSVKKGAEVHPRHKSQQESGGAQPRDLQCAPAPAQRSPFRWLSHKIVILSEAPHRLIA